jgi:hypothetical protein
MQTQTEKKKTVREQMIAVGLQTVVVVVVVVLLLFVGVVSGSGTLYVFTNFKDDFEGNTRARRQTDRQRDRQRENSPRAHKLFRLLRAMIMTLNKIPPRKRI